MYSLFCYMEIVTSSCDVRARSVPTGMGGDGKISHLKDSEPQAVSLLMPLRH